LFLNYGNGMKYTACWYWPYRHLANTAQIQCRCSPVHTDATAAQLYMYKLEMWANAQRDGRPAEYRWRPLFNAAKCALWFLLSIFFYLSLSIFFPRQNLSGRRLDVYHTSTQWCGLSANLECRYEMCCARLAGNAGPKKSQKNRHLGTIAQLETRFSTPTRT